MTASGDSLLVRGPGCPTGAAALFRPAPEVDEDPDEEEDEDPGYEEPDELEEENGEEDEDEEETWQVAVFA